MTDDEILELAKAIADDPDTDLEPLQDAADAEKRRTIDALGVLQKIRRFHSAGDDPEIGRIVANRYRIEERIGSGGMGDVFRAHDLTLRRTVAIKFLRPKARRQDDSKRRFLHEARAAAALEHPAIAPVFDAGESEDGSRYIAMAYYEAESLRDRIARGPLPAGRAVAIATTLAEALAYAHAHGVVHRDVKPANVLLTPDGGVKLIDFGVARQSASTVLTQSGALVGTPLYMSPEQITGGDVDGRADVWALSAVLFEMLTGRRPFEADEPEAVLYSIVHGKPPELEISGPAGRELAAIVEKGLAKRPEHRFASCLEMASRLRRLLEEFPDEAATTIRRPRRSARLAGSWKITVPVLLVATAIAFWLWVAIRDPPHGVVASDSAVAVLPFENLTGNAEMRYLGMGVAAGVTTGLSELPELAVVSRARTWAAVRGSDDPARLGSELGVGVLIAGEVQGYSPRVRIGVSVLDAATGRILWSQSFDGDQGDLYGIQQRIVGTLARVLSVRLTAAQRRQLARAGPAAKAFDYYLQGLERLDDPSNLRNAALAEDLFRQAIRMDDQVAVFHAALSNSLSAQARVTPTTYLEAESEAREALRLDPELLEGYLALARALRLQGRYAESIAELRSLLARHPNADHVFRELAYGYELAGDLDNALECFETAVALGPESWFNWNALGAFQAVQGQRRAARDALVRAVTLAPPTVVWPRLNLGGVLLQLGELDQAILEFEATGAATRDAELASNLATVYYLKGELDEAERLYRTAVELQPDRHVMRRNLGDVLLALDRREDALDAFRHALQIVEEQLASDPDDKELLRARPLYAAKLGDCQAAVAYAESTETIAAGDLPVLRNLAMTYALCDEPEQALASIAAAIDLGDSGTALRQNSELRSLFDHPEFKRLTDG